MSEWIKLEDSSEFHKDKTSETKYQTNKYGR